MSHGQVCAFLYEIKKQAWSEEVSYGSRRDLACPFAPPPASIPITLRLFERGDERYFAGPAGLWHRLIEKRIGRTSRTEFIAADMPRAYVAVTPDGSPCFIQWLIAPSANEKAESYRRRISSPFSR